MTTKSDFGGQSSVRDPFVWASMVPEFDLDQIQLLEK
jgi:hypothetical protein